MRVSEIPFQNVSVDEALPGLAHGAAVGDVGHVQVEEDLAHHVGHAHLEQPREGGGVVALLLHLCWTFWYPFLQSCLLLMVSRIVLLLLSSLFREVVLEWQNREKNPPLSPFCCVG